MSKDPEPRVEGPPGSAVQGLRWHILAMLWLGLVVTVGLAAKPSHAALRERVLEGSAEQRMRALHALSQRAPEALDEALIQSLLSDPDARLRELAFTNVISRHTGKQALVTLASERPDPGERWRALFWLTRDVASHQRMTRGELRAYFDTFRSEPTTR